MRTADLVAIGRFIACEGNCGDIAVNGRYCRDCQKFADELDERAAAASRSAGDRLRTFGWIAAIATLIYFLCLGVLWTADKWMGLG